MLPSTEAAILKVSVATRVLTVVLQLLTHALVPSWDDSGEAAIAQTRRSGLDWLASPFLRWDGIHFLGIAQHGYRLEQHFAFSPGVPWLLRLFGYAFSNNEFTATHAVLGVSILAFCVSCSLPILLYRLTVQLTRSPQLAHRAALLYCLFPAPAIMSSPYTEPFFAFSTFLGLLYASNDQIWPATAAFAVSSFFRATGVMNIGFLIYYGAWQRKSPLKFLMHVPITALVSTLAAAPFLLHQAFAHDKFCMPMPTRHWCSDNLPLPYAFVQSHYWDVGWLRYFTMQQSPNFVLAAPILLLAVAAGAAYYRNRWSFVFVESLPRCFRQTSTSARDTEVPLFLSPKLLPAIHLHVIQTFLLITTSHVQISLRQACTNPVIYWYLAHLSSRASPFASVWTAYAIVWGALSIVLWTAHYPPA